MGQGKFPINSGVLVELTLDLIDLAKLKERLLLPDGYRIESIRCDATVDERVTLLVSADEIPDGATVTPIYQRLTDKPELVRVDIQPN